MESDCVVRSARGRFLVMKLESSPSRTLRLILLLVSHRARFYAAATIIPVIRDANVRVLFRFQMPGIGRDAIRAIRPASQQTLHATILQAPHVAHGVVHAEVQEGHVVEVEPAVMRSWAVEEPGSKVLVRLISVEVIVEAGHRRLAQPRTVVCRQAGQRRKLAVHRAGLRLHQGRRWEALRLSHLRP